MNDPVIIDTMCFNDLSFISWLKDYHGRKTISSITYAELQYHFVINKRKSLGLLKTLLKRSQIKIQNLRSSDIDQTMEFVKDHNSHIPWLDNQMDYLIAGHVHNRPTKLVTQDKKFFEYLQDNCVLGMYEFKKMASGK